jgi:hypothetical protein
MLCALCQQKGCHHLPFALGSEVGPFIAKTRLALEHVDKILAGMHMPKASRWKYDPHNIIYNLMRNDSDREAHKHEPN